MEAKEASARGAAEVRSYWNSTIPISGRERVQRLAGAASRPLAGRFKLDERDASNVPTQRVTQIYWGTTAAHAS
jgi:hypothetical protein